ncbi:DNA primase [Streptomyces caniscabiei]|uniref:DNA primase n=1 Tax=Streptomyces caniscabiei TaxID=2746961 RepID=A0A927KXV9_9ACTN|nr:DNA primase [Streptomyces caniscabiei]MBD9721847.1 DNA primase [Streptomyces caniscabiei]MDX3509039.1 DNA primase [Streptomyces caniscabiei]MDX3717208.1 DNA primase [Streptomyces caniscabiei]WEO23072.1 DNA primase [Streptomyces caniscabiei]
MNRIGLGLAVGAGYVLGRTKKMKLAFAIGTMVAGKRMHLNPRALAELASQQLQNNPQFKELGDQLREDLRGAGKAATGALVERQIEGLADRLHGRTSQVRDQLAGVTPDVSGRDEDEDEEEPEPGHEAPEESRRSSRGQTAKKPPPKKAAAKKTAARKTAPAKKAAQTKKTAPAKKAARKATRSRTTRGGGGDD